MKKQHIYNPVVTKKLNKINLIKLIFLKISIINKYKVKIMKFYAVLINNKIKKV